MIPKFRAWDKRKKKFIRLSALHIEESGENVGLVYDMSEHYISTAFSVGGGRSLNLRDGVLMQSTGLKDKNGVEIYEGDVIASQNTDRKNWYVSHHVVVWHDTGFMGKQICSSSYIGLEHWTKRENGYVVIGNIHENPELLKEVE